MLQLKHLIAEICEVFTYDSFDRNKIISVVMYLGKDTFVDCIIICI